MMSISLLEAFGAAWNRHDLDAIMDMTAEDGEFWSAAGSQACGERYAGKEAVRAAYAGIFATFPDGQWTKSRVTMIGPERGMSEWLFVGTKTDGSRVEVDGLDLLDLAGGKVRIKNSFRKARSA
jgi:ketosteroid isomerase-like protein